MCACASVCVFKRKNIYAFERERGCVKEVCVYVRE